MKFLYSVPFFLFFLLFCGKSGNIPQQLATVGKRTITVAEFKDRASFTPVTGMISLQQHKENILNTIIAEALLGQSQTALPDYIPLIIAQKEREAVIEKFWEEIIFKDIAVKDSALWEFYVNSKMQREIEFAIFNDSLSAHFFFQQWRKGNALVNRVLSRDTLSFSGEIAILDKSVFQTLLDSVASPVMLGRKFLVYKPLREWQISPPVRQEFNEKYRSLRKSYLKTLKHEYFIEYARKTFKKENYRLDRDLFKKLTRALENRTLRKPSLSEFNAELYNFSPENSDDLNPEGKIVHFDNGPSWSIRTFLKHLAVSPYPLDYTSEGAFRYSLVKAARRMLDDELLYRKGLQNNLDRSEYVRWQTAMWSDFYKAGAVLAAGKNSVNEVHNMLDSLRNEYEIDIHWSVFDTLTINRTDMVVLKTHFPGQTIVPKKSYLGFKIERE